MCDIAKCTGENCPIKDKCWRYRIPPTKNYYQWYCSPPEEKPCPLFISIPEETQKFIDEEKNDLL